MPEAVVSFKDVISQAGDQWGALTNTEKNTIGNDYFQERIVPQIEAQEPDKTNQLRVRQQAKADFDAQYGLGKLDQGNALDGIGGFVNKGLEYGTYGIADLPEPTTQAGQTGGNFGAMAGGLVSNLGANLAGGIPFVGPVIKPALQFAAGAGPDIREQLNAGTPIERLNYGEAGIQGLASLAGNRIQSLGKTPLTSLFLNGGVNAAISGGTDAAVQASQGFPVDYNRVLNSAGAGFGLSAAMHLPSVIKGNVKQPQQAIQQRPIGLGQLQREAPGAGQAALQQAIEQARAEQQQPAPVQPEPVQPQGPQRRFVQGPAPRLEAQVTGYGEQLRQQQQQGRIEETATRHAKILADKVAFKLNVKKDLERLVKEANLNDNPELQATARATLDKYKAQFPDPVKPTKQQPLQGSVEENVRLREPEAPRVEPSGLPARDPIQGSDNRQQEIPAQNTSNSKPVDAGSVEKKQGAKQAGKYNQYGPEIAEKLEAVDKKTAFAIESQKTGFQPEDVKQKIIKGAILKGEAQKREIIQDGKLEPVAGGLTKRELEAKITYEQSNYKGKKVKVGDKTGTVVSTPFGKVKVEFEDGTSKTFEPSQLKPVQGKTAPSKPPASPPETTQKPVEGYATQNAVDANAKTWADVKGVANKAAHALGETLDTAIQNERKIRVKYTAEIGGRSHEAVHISKSGKIDTVESDFSPTHFATVDKIVDTQTGQTLYHDNPKAANGKTLAVLGQNNQRTENLIKEGKAEVKTFVMVKGYNQRGYPRSYYLGKSPEGSLIEAITKKDIGPAFRGDIPNVYKGPQEYKLADLESRGLNVSESGAIKTSTAKADAEKWANLLQSETFKTLPEPVRKTLKAANKKGRFDGKDFDALQGHLEKDMKALKAVCSILGLG